MTWMSGGGGLANVELCRDGSSRRKGSRGSRRQEGGGEGRSGEGPSVGRS